MKNREEWFTELAMLMREKFESVGLTFPDSFQISSSEPRSSYKGICYNPITSEDRETFNIFINASEDGGLETAGTLAHELIHACGINGHGKLFKEAASSLGFEPTRYTPLTPEFVKWVTPLLHKVGPYHFRVMREAEKTSSAEADPSELQVTLRCTNCDYMAKTKMFYLELGRLTCPICIDPDSGCKDIKLLTKKEKEEAIDSLHEKEEE